MGALSDVSSSDMSTSSRSVSFSSLEIRNYPITLGDCPTDRGPPIQLGWRPDTTDTYTVQYYEEYRTTEAPRRSKAEMLLPADYRTDLLREGGFSRSEIKSAEEEAANAAKKRRETIKRLNAQPIEEKLEKARKNFSKFSKLAASLR